MTCILTSSIRALREIKPEALAMLGCPDVVYIKFISYVSWEVHGANGDLLGKFVNPDDAMCACAQNALQVASVH